MFENVHAKTVQQRPLLPRKVETRLPDCGINHIYGLWQASKNCLFQLFLLAKNK